MDFTRNEEPQAIWDILAVFGASRLMRPARPLPICERTHRIQRVLIARQLLGALPMATVTARA